MNADQQAALDRVPRFLDELEPIDRKKLNRENKRKERWSLSGKQDDSQVLAEMGVAPLCNEFSDEEKGGSASKENIENLSPKCHSGRATKRTYLQAVLSPKDNLSRDEHDSGLKKSRMISEHLDNQCPSSNDACVEGKFVSEKMSTAGINVPNKVGSPLRQIDNNINNNQKNILNNSNFALKTENNFEAVNSDLVKTNANKLNDTKSIPTTTVNVGENAKHKMTHDVVKTKSHDEVSEAATERNVSDDLNETKDVFSFPEDEAERNILSLSKNIYSHNTTKRDLHSNKCEENVCPLSTVDQAILDFADEDLEQTMVHDKDDINEGYFGLSEEKECFTLQDRSGFCRGDTCSKAKCNSALNSKETEDDTDSMFSKLSDEVVLSILQWLPKRVLVRCMHVCKRWRRLSADGRLWARVDLGGRVLPSGALQTLMDRHPLVLRMANAQLTSPVLLSVCASEWRVQFLDLSCATLSPKCVTTILHNSPQLIKLSIEGLTIDKDAHKAFGRLCHLRTLNASQVIGFNADCCKSLLKMPRLEHLNLSWTRLDTEALNILTTTLNPGLLRFNLAGCRKTIQDELVTRLVERLPDLVELDLSDAAHISTNSIKALVQLRALEHLAISRCYFLQLRDYMLLGQCRSLLYVDAFGILPPLTIPLLMKHLPNIQFNKFMHSSIARPTVGNRRTSVWGLRTRD